MLFPIRQAAPRDGQREFDVSLPEVQNDYRRAAEQARRDRLVLDNLALVRHVLGRLLGEMPPGVDVENLEAAGVLGLVEAAARYDPTRDAQFRTFAYLRVRGAIVDELRRNSVFPQQVLQRIGAVRRARIELPARASADEIARRAGLTEDEVAETLAAMRMARPAAWEEAAGTPDRRPPPDAAIEAGDEVRRMIGLIEKLPERTRLVLTLYYHEDLRLKEIGEIVGLSASRLSRLIDATLFDLREVLRAAQ